ncbi:MAG: imelysin family protein [Bacteroidota bacterium]
MPAFRPLGFALSCAFLLLAGCDPSSDPAEDRAAVRAAMLTDLADRVIATSHASFAEQAATLEAAVIALQATPSQATLNAARAEWLEAARQFRRLSALNLPGVRFGLYHNRISTWPADTERIEDRLATESTFDLALIQRQGSNLRGLPALEYFLFDSDDASSLGTNRLEYAASVATDISGQADALLEKWSRDGGNELGMFEAADTEGRNFQSSISRIVNEMAMVAEDLRYVKVGRPLGIARDPGDPNSDPKPELVESPFAEESIALFREDLAGLRALLTADGGTGLDDYLETLDAELDGQPFAAALLAQIDATDQAAAAVTPSLRQNLSANAGASQALYDETITLLRLIKTDMANWLGVSITFSDNDGD